MLVEQVNEYIVAGWVPLGGVSAGKSVLNLYPEETSYHLMQAMFREFDERQPA